MKRREFLVLAGSAMAAARQLHAEQKAMPVIGWLSGASPVPTAPYLAAFLRGLSEAGWIEGRNVAIEYRWAENRYDRLPELAAGLVAHNVDVIAAIGGTHPGISSKKRDRDNSDRFFDGRPGRVGSGRQPCPAGR